LDPLPNSANALFVGDIAVVFDRNAVIMRLGTESRRGEINDIISALTEFVRKFDFIPPDGLINGGDICITDDHMLIGLSERTNEEGGHQLTAFSLGNFEVTTIDIRGIHGLPHLKSGLSYLGEDRMLVTEVLADRPELKGFEIVRVPDGEEYAANCICVNDHVIVPYPFRVRCRNWMILAIGRSL
jgi:dimethylargininase